MKTETIILHLRPLRDRLGRDPSYRLRGALKLLLRRFGFRCVKIDQVGDSPNCGLTAVEKSTQLVTVTTCDKRTGKDGKELALEPIIRKRAKDKEFIRKTTLQKSAESVDTRAELEKVSGLSVPQKSAEAVDTRKELALKLEAMFREKAEKHTGGRGKLIQKSEKVSTQHELAKVSGLSHITTAARCLLAEKLAEALKPLAKDNKVESGKVTGRSNKKVLAILPKPLNTREAAVSHDTTAARCLLAEKLEAMFREKAEKHTGGRGKLIQKSEKVSTQHELAKVSGLSHDTTAARCLLAEKLAEALRPLAKEKQRQHGGTGPGIKKNTSVNIDGSVDAREAAVKEANVSAGSMSAFKYVKANADKVRNLFPPSPSRGVTPFLHPRIAQPCDVSPQLDHPTHEKPKENDI
jgi:hypothetical protein